ncbi:DUF1501 domain-containing protein [Caulobacter sp. NIBR2454]|uniref:DUF1501 domain-containing protein n=1 Tax=Caulobacter sp. NIBR2454 TaxID=3015996 RepID=UPI0022B63011|nr:DUF1501 domain-containing protein [Caulobacter sp. NIBR2454]
MNLSRRDFGRLALGSGAAATLGTLGLTSAVAANNADYRAVVTIFLYGGNDGFNTLIPVDKDRHKAYSDLRGPSIALQQEDLEATKLSGTNFAMHPSFAPLVPLWEEGAMSWVLNVGTLLRPLTRDQFWAHPEWRPSNLSSHSDEQAHWQSMRPGSIHPDGVLGRMADRIGFSSAASPLISTNGANLALMGNASSPLILPLYSPFERVGYEDGGGEAAVLRKAALNAFASEAEAHNNTLLRLTGKGFEDSYTAGKAMNPILRGEQSSVDSFFNEAGGGFRDAQVSRQLRLIARTIEQAGRLGHKRQIFYAGQGDYDTHANQVAGGRVLGAHADMLTDLALSIRSFYAAMKSLGLEDKVTIVTMSDFGRTFKGNGSNGSDHGWGNAHFVIGGGLKPRTIHGLYPQLAFGTGDDAENEGSWIPTIANEEYFGSVAQWFGVSSADMGYVFPNWGNWNGGGRGPVPLFA